MAGKTYAILGGGGSFGIHAAFYLLDHAQPKKVIGIGRNPLRPEPFSLGMAEREGYVYHARHVTHELDLLLELLDREKPEVIVNFAAQLGLYALCIQAQCALTPSAHSRSANP